MALLNFLSEIGSYSSPKSAYRIEQIKLGEFSILWPNIRISVRMSVCVNIDIL